LAKDVAARHLWCLGAGGHRTFLSTRHGYLYRPPADNHRFDAAFSNSLLKFSHNRTEDIAFGRRLRAGIGRKRRRLASRRGEFLARVCRRTG
jgi:hypothetical protein